MPLPADGHCQTATGMLIYPSPEVCACLVQITSISLIISGTPRTECYLLITDNFLQLNLATTMGVVLVYSQLAP